MSKKKRKYKSKTLWEIYKSIRKVWIINPRTRVKKSKKIYNRQKAKRELKRRIKEES